MQILVLTITIQLTFHCLQLPRTQINEASERRLSAYPRRCGVAVLEAVEEIVTVPEVGPATRRIEVCHLNTDGEIEECEIVEEGELPLVLGLDQAARVLNEQRGYDKAADLLF